MTEEPRIDLALSRFFFYLSLLFFTSFSILFRPWTFFVTSTSPRGDPLFPFSLDSIFLVFFFFLPVG